MKVFDANVLPDDETVRNILLEEGILLVTGVLSPAYLKRVTPVLEAAIVKEAAYHGGTNNADYGMVLVCSLYGDAFLEVFDNRALMRPFEAVLGEGCVVYAFTSSSMPPGKTNYARRVHRDCPTTRMARGFPTNMGATILLDDFTSENGASYFLERSHGRKDAPSVDELERDALRLLAPAGSVLFFDALTWHAGGDNRSRAWRHALTINMCRSWMKQRLDLPRLMSDAGVDMTRASESVKQKLGYFTQVPASYDEYYAPAEARKYRQQVE